MNTIGEAMAALKAVCDGNVKMEEAVIEKSVSLVPVRTTTISARRLGKDFIGSLLVPFFPQHGSTPSNHATRRETVPIPGFAFQMVQQQRRIFNFLLPARTSL
jgi:hypothetical protein